MLIRNAVTAYVAAFLIAMYVYMVYINMATITLFYMLAFWNDWWLALLFIDDYKLYPLQYLLRMIQSNILYVMQGMNTVVKQSAIPKETVQMAMCVVTIGPIIFVYPFIQRYFVKGITIGAVKG